MSLKGLIVFLLLFKHLIEPLAWGGEGIKCKSFS